MTLYLFNKLDLFQKVDILYKQGSIVGARETEEFHVLLYQIHSFYVEMYYPLNSSQLARLHCFKSTSQLKPYLEQINLENLLSWI